MNEIRTEKDELENRPSGLSSQLISELISPTIDLSVDYAEIFIDDLMENEALKEIPIVKSIVGVIKGGVAINQFWFAKKLLTFIKEFSSNKASRDQVENFKVKINNDPKFGKRIAEQLMIHIDRHIEITQTKILANLFRSYLNEEISFEQFFNILISLDSLHPSSYNFFFELEKSNYEFGHETENSDRKWEIESLITSSGLGEETSGFWHGFKLKEEGVLLFKFGIKPTYN